MYIESADLSERHAEIKFEDGCRYVLRDCESEGGKVFYYSLGTWVRISSSDLY